MKRGLCGVHYTEADQPAQFAKSACLTKVWTLMQTKVYWPIITIYSIRKLPRIYNRDIEKAPKGLNAAAVPDCLA